MQKISYYFFWLKWIEPVIEGFLWWIILMLIVISVPFLRVWWWVFLPLFLSVELRKLYLWWVGWDFAYPQIKWVVLELIPPRIANVPIKATEDALSVIWPVLLDVGNFREIYCEGELAFEPSWMSLEIVSIEGKIHFFVRISDKQKAQLENALLSHYPDLEIKEVADYTKDVPQTMPNEDWDLYGENYVLKRNPALPIKTYESFFEPPSDKILVPVEEKRIDPLNSMLESMSKLGPGEQYWVQFIIGSTLDVYEPSFKIDGENLINQIAKRPIKTKKHFADSVLEVMHNVAFGPRREGSAYKWRESVKQKAGGERELMITPGERDVIAAIENKLSKPIFRTTFRGIYLAKRENFNSANKYVSRAYAGHFYTENMNYLGFSALTRTKVHYLFRKRRVYLRARKMFANAVLRFPPLFPDRTTDTTLLSTEELATLFHFPIKMSGAMTQSIHKVEHKKVGPPPNLPI